MTVKFADIYIPKKDTQQADFLKEHPKFDGRNTVIGIIDGGIVDISLPGMQKTTTGLPKVIDCFDFSDDGIVDTCFIFETFQNETKNLLPGLSGRKLNIPSYWKNPSKKWHLGKIGFEKLGFRATLKKSETLKHSDVLNIVDEKTPEKFVDCIVWFDGKKWRAVVDTSFSENLDSLKTLTNFADEHEYSFIDDKKTISFCVKIEKNGNQLQIIVPRFDHGNSVTHAAVSHFPNEPEKDGLAPGAQIISINIHESTREKTECKYFKSAFLKLIEIGAVDVINISVRIDYISGIAEIIEEMVEKHGIIIAVAAGNAGPSFKSIEPFPLFFNHLFVIGSVFTNDMHQKLRKTEKSNEYLPNVFWYSSKGPSSNSYARGIDFVAPGVAITSNPRWHKDSTDLFVGTSIAAPIAAGSISCLISALKANSIQYSPSKIRLSLSNTALIPKNGNGLEFGNGIFQIKDAFQFFIKNFTNVSSINFATLKDIKTDKMGIFYIHEQKNQSYTNFCFKLNPSLRKSNKWDIKIFSNSTTKFVGHPDTIKYGNLLSIKIDPNSLTPGTLSYAEIRGFDSSNPFLGPLFNLPITVIFPQRVTKKHCIQKSIVLYPCSSYSYFFYPPYESNQFIFQIIISEATDVELIIEFPPNKHYPILFTSEDMTQSLTLPIHWKRMQEIHVFRKIEFQNKNTSEILRFSMNFTFIKKS